MHPMRARAEGSRWRSRARRGSLRLSMVEWVQRGRGRGAARSDGPMRGRKPAESPYPWAWKAVSGPVWKLLRRPWVFCRVSAHPDSTNGALRASIHDERGGEASLPSGAKARFGRGIGQRGHRAGKPAIEGARGVRESVRCVSPFLTRLYAHSVSELCFRHDGH